MLKKCFIVIVVLCGLSSCVSMQLSVDDAYHWEEKGASNSSASSHSSKSAVTGSISQTKASDAPVTTIIIPAESKIVSISGENKGDIKPTSSSSPTLEYINVQDTTVTVRIKR